MFNKSIGIALFFLTVGGIALSQTRAKVAPLPVRERSLKTCEVHRTALQLGTATILYGKRNSSFNRVFPHAHSTVLGGCVISKDSPELQTVKFCPKCRAAENRWLVAHHQTIPTR